jgi:hypothetical protein
MLAVRGVGILVQALLVQNLDNRLDALGAQLGRRRGGQRAIP